VNVLEKLNEMQRVLAAREYDVHPLIVMPPADPRQVAELESAVGTRLPSAFRDVLLKVSAHVEYRWFAGDRTFAPPFHQNFSGDLHWSVDLTAQIETRRKDWCSVAFSNTGDPYDAVWQNKLAFYEIGNGDLLAFDLADDKHGQVVYLSHDDGEGHGYVLARDFQDLLVRWLPLGCTGGEDWQWLPFTASQDSGLEPHSEPAMAWRSILGIDSVWRA
jgi:SMI1 / KNR4 family (SUKH-1)